MKVEEPAARTKQAKPTKERAATSAADAPADQALFVRCPACRERAYRKDLERRLNVCASCGYHFRLTVEQRLLITVDRGSFAEIDATLAATDPLRWVDQKPYPERLAAARASTGHGDALVTGTASVEGVPVALAIFDFAFMGGSMGTVVGEKLARLVELAIARALPLVVFAASGGARMQEGTLSLFQMAKVASLRTRLREAGLPYVCVLTDPTTGGVAASLAMLGDVQVAEPGALIGFAGPRVIEQTIHQTLPKGFQSAEMVLEHGMIDVVVPRRELRDTLARILRVLVHGRAAQAARGRAERA
jgi:acetyl-CoA carboxylase carboxyl transferase subunit beta